MDSAEWKSLILRVTAGDKDAEEALFSILYRPLWRYLMRRTGDHILTDDLTQDVFLKWHKTLPHIEIQESPLPYLFTVARNTLIDHRRKKKSVSLESLDIDVPDTTNETKSMISAESKHEVEQALLRLRPEEQLIIELFVYENYSGKEIAHMTGKSESSVRQIKHRAIEKIKTLLPHYKTFE